MLAGTPTPEPPVLLSPLPPVPEKGGQPQDGGTDAALLVPIVGGTWRDAAGFVYELQQSGEYISFRQIGANGPTGAWGSGRLDGFVLRLEYRVQSEQVGTWTLELRTGPGQLVGTYTDLRSGQTLPSVLTR